MSTSRKPLTVQAAEYLAEVRGKETKSRSEQNIKPMTRIVNRVMEGEGRVLYFRIMYAPDTPSYTFAAIYANGTWHLTGHLGHLGDPLTPPELIARLAAWYVEEIEILV